MRGFQALAAYNIRMKSPTAWLYAVEPSFRYDLADPDSDAPGDRVTTMTAVLGVYFSSRAWFRAGYERQELPGRHSTQHQRRAQHAGRQLLVDEDTSMRHSLRFTAALVGLTMATGGPAAAQGLTGAGATFPNPIYTKWFDAYHKKTGVQINYQSIGSGGGIRQFTEGTVDFGASDGPMNESQIAAVNGNVLHVPTVLGAVVVTYNLPALGDTKLKLDGNALVDIFMGRIIKWNDPKLAKLNPGVKLPDLDWWWCTGRTGRAPATSSPTSSTSSPASGGTRSATPPR